MLRAGRGLFKEDESILIYIRHGVFQPYSLKNKSFSVFFQALSDSARVRIS